MPYRENKGFFGLKTCDAVGVSLKTILGFFAGLLLWGFTVFPAHGYVLQGQHLLDLMTENIGKANSLIVRQRLFLFDAATPDHPSEIQETLTYWFPDAFRSDSKSPNMDRIHVDTGDAVVTVFDGQVSAGDENRFDRYKDLLLFRSRALLQDRLFKAGMDPLVSSLGRFQGEPVYVLGARYPDESRSQIWIEKETFRPLRLLIPEEDVETGTSVLEFRYLQWEKKKGLWYPIRIQCYQNDQLVREMVVDQLAVDALNSEAVFDVEYLKALYAPADEFAREIPAQETPSDIQKAIDDFKKRYE